MSKAEVFFETFEEASKGRKFLRAAIIKEDEKGIKSVDDIFDVAAVSVVSFGLLHDYVQDHIKTSGYTEVKYTMRETLVIS